MIRLLTCIPVALGLSVGCACAAGPASGQGFDKIDIPLLPDGKPDPADTNVAGYLFKPAGVGPFPATILMHGCDGLEWERPKQAG